jgi:hypothetical protein
MRDFRDAKAMAHTLRGALQGKTIDITHGECLELIAKAFGFDNWNVLAAKIDAAVPRAPKAPAEPGDPGKKATLYCSFCGKSQHDVVALIAGPNSFICNECTGLCNDIVDNTEISGLLKADEESGDQAYPAALAQLRAKPSEDLVSWVERSRRGAERHRLELRHIQRMLATLQGEGPAADAESVPSRFAHLKGMTRDKLGEREQHVVRGLKRYEDALRIVTGVLDGR